MLEHSRIPAKNSIFTIPFPGGHTALAVCVSPSADPLWVMERFGITNAIPAIFISGGASYMTDEDKARTTEMMGVVADFAERHGAVVIDGGTDAGVMQIIGGARRQHNYTFPLIGVCPIGKVSYPGFENLNHEANLEDSHSHFVLVLGNEWGDETNLLIRLTYTISGKGSQPAIGILINGGRIAQNEVYLATTKDLRLPMIVVEGSGRFADELATAFRTGKTNQQILKAILEGGDIKLISTIEGPEKMREHLTNRFDLP
jgi:hypothetical protein